jgi:hypothetical protein
MKIFTYLSIIILFIFSSCQNDNVQLINNTLHAVPTVNAGASKLVYIPSDSVSVTGSGSSQNGPIAAYLWSFVTGPNQPIIVSPGQRTTLIKNLVLGNYVFQFSVIDSAGIVGVDTMVVKVLPSIFNPGNQTITLQPANNVNELNFMLQAYVNATTHTSSLLAMNYSPLLADTIISRGAFKFDLSGIPAGATLVSASLSLFSNPTPTSGPMPFLANFGTNNAMRIMRLRNNWTPTTTWFQQPIGDTASAVMLPHTNLNALDVLDIDVKQQVNQMLSLGNNGFIISLIDDQFGNINCGRNFASSLHPTASKRPKLVLVYQ